MKYYYNHTNVNVNKNNRVIDKEETIHKEEISLDPVFKSFGEKLLAVKDDPEAIQKLISESNIDAYLRLK